MSLDERPAADARGSCGYSFDPTTTDGGSVPSGSVPHAAYEDIDGETNHALNLQHAEIEGLGLSHGRLDQGLIRRNATVGNPGPRTPSSPTT